MIKTYIWTPRSIFYYARELSYTLKWPWTMLLKLFLLLVYIEEFWNLFQSTQHGQKHISGHQDQPSTMPGSWVTPWSGPGPCCWHCSWCWCTSDSSVTCSNQLSMVKNIYLDIKINLLWCQEASMMPGNWYTPRMSPWTCCWHHCWCWSTFVKQNIFLS